MGAYTSCIHPCMEAGDLVPSSSPSVTVYLSGGNTMPVLLGAGNSWNFETDGTDDSQRKCDSVGEVEIIRELCVNFEDSSQRSQACSDLGDDVGDLQELHAQNGQVHVDNAASSLLQENERVIDDAMHTSFEHAGAPMLHVRSAPVTVEDEAMEQARKTRKRDQRTAARQAQKNVQCLLELNGFSDIKKPRRWMLRTSYPLHIAVKSRDPKMVRAFLNAGADPTMADSAGRTPMQLAEKKNWGGSHDVVLKALRQGQRRTMDRSSSEPACEVMTMDVGRRSTATTA